MEFRTKYPYEYSSKAFPLHKGARFRKCSRRNKKVLFIRV